MGVTDHDPGGPAGAPLARPGPQGPDTLPSTIEHFQRQGPCPPPRVERVGLPCPGEGPAMCAHRALRARLSFPTSFPEGDPEADDPFSLGGIPHCRGPLVQSVGLRWGIRVSHRILSLRGPPCGTGQVRGRPPPKGQDERRGSEMRCDCTQQPLLQDKGTPLSPVHKSCSLSGLEPECSPVFHLYLDKIKPMWAHAMESRLTAAPHPRWEPLLCVAGVATPVLTPPPRPARDGAPLTSSGAPLPGKKFPSS